MEHNCKLVEAIPVRIEKYWIADIYFLWYKIRGVEKWVSIDKNIMKKYLELYYSSELSLSFEKKTTFHLISKRHGKIH